MNGIVKQIDERLGCNYHEVEFQFHLSKGLMITGCCFSEKYYVLCNKSTLGWTYCMFFQEVYQEGAYACVIYMSRFDDLLIPINVNFTLTLSNSIGLVCPELHFPKTGIVSGQEMKSFHPVLHYKTLLSIAGQPLDVTLCFRFTGCHNNKRERDSSPNSDESCTRSAKQSKVNF